MKLYPHYVVVGFSNSYLISGKESSQAVIIDPGRFDAKMLSLIENNKLKICAILLTNSNKSHVSGIKTLLKIYDAKIYSYHASIVGIKTIPVRDRQQIKCGDLTFTVIETPGHSADSVVYRLGNWLFTGDTLSAGLTGTTPHLQAHILQLKKIREKLLPLGDELIVFPGHGPPSRLGLERRFNVMLNELCPRARSNLSFF